VAAIAIEHAVNLLSLVYAHIYFPTFSNGLKDIAGYLGFRWSGSLVSGADAIVWRHRWEASKDPGMKRALLDYNREDCEALELVANRLIDLHRVVSADDRSSHSNVVLASEIKRESPFPLRFGRNSFMLPELETINRAAYWNYQRERVYVKARSKRVRSAERYSRRGIRLRPNIIIECPMAVRCPTCKSKLIRRPAIAAYAIYQNIELGLPQRRVAASVSQLFDFYLPHQTVNLFKATAAEHYSSTYNRLLRKLCSGPLLHVDETRASVLNRDCYVWALSSMEEVAYFRTANREGSAIHAMLKDFSGVLVSDFYAAYDAVECPQQKCLIHLIRDLNDDLLKHPFDDTLKRLVIDLSRLVRAIVETVDRRGLKKRFLGRHRAPVAQFYDRLDRACNVSEATTKVMERLRKNRDRLFTFLDFDGVPWNNNNAEHAIKAFALLRRRLIPLTQVHLYVVGVAHEAGRRFCEDCLA
jgi:hypothetical protein